MLAKKYNAKEAEAKWLKYWKDNNIYEFKEDGREVFSIDTPPPTVNGKIHIGHIFPSLTVLGSPIPANSLYFVKIVFFYHFYVAYVYVHVI